MKHLTLTVPKLSSRYADFNSIKVKEENALLSPTKRRPGRPKKAASAIAADSTVSRRRGRPSKTPVDDDNDYQPTESDL